MSFTKPATSQDVAKLAGVSQSAVSRCFTKGASISTRTKLRVLEAAKKLKYKPSCWWANYYNIGHYADTHSHWEAAQPEEISSIIIIKTDKSNPLYFDFDPGILNVKEEEGLVLLFDSKIKHGVNKCEDSRITFAIDFVRDI